MTEEELQIWKDIEAGKYSNDYIGYIRKSTDEPNNQKNSLTYQKHEILRFAQNEYLPIAQKKLTKKNKSKKYDTPLPNPFRAQFTCDGCRRSYTPYFKKGHLYLGSRCAVECSNSNKNFNVDFITKNISKIVSGLSFSKEEIGVIDSRIKNYLEVLEKDQNSKQEENKNKKNKLSEDLAYLQENKLTLLKTGVYTPQAIVDEVRKLETAISNISNLEHVSVQEIQEAVQNVYKLSELLKDFIPQWEFANSHEKQDLLKIMFSELSVSEKTLDYKVTSGLVPIQSRFFSLCARERT